MVPLPAPGINPVRDALPTQRLGERPGLADVPVVFITAKVQATEIEYFKSLGALDVIAKPFDPVTLASQVQAIWDTAKAARS